METKNKIDISVVIPFYNEAKQCIHTLNVMDALLAKLPYRFELVAVNDGSKDNTDKLLSEHSMEQVRFKYVCLSRNFGKESAILAGMSVAEGEAVIFMDGDLQHPPELIPEMIKKWKEGYDVVNAVKQSRGHESFLYKCFSLFFYSLISKATNADLKGHSDFKLLDREVVDILLNLPEKNRFFRGLVSWVGFKSINIPFDVQERPDGTGSKWSILKLIVYSIKNITSFTSLPLIWVIYVGVFFLFASAILFFQTLYNYYSGNALNGFTTVILVSILLSGIMLIQLGIMGLYISQVFDEVKNRPCFIIRKPK